MLAISYALCMVSCRTRARASEDGGSEGRDRSATAARPAALLHRAATVCFPREGACGSDLIPSILCRSVVVVAWGGGGVAGMLREFFASRCMHPCLNALGCLRRRLGADGDGRWSCFTRARRARGRRRVRAGREDDEGLRAGRFRGPWLHRGGSTAARRYALRQQSLASSPHGDTQGLLHRQHCATYRGRCVRHDSTHLLLPRERSGSDWLSAPVGAPVLSRWELCALTCARSCQRAAFTAFTPAPVFPAALAAADFAAAAALAAALTPAAESSTLVTTALAAAAFAAAAFAGSNFMGTQSG